MKKFLIITIILLPLSNYASDSLKILWDKLYGGSKMEAISASIRTADSNIVVVGFTKSNDLDVSNNYGKTDVWVLKINQKGNIVWEKSYGGSQDDYGFAIKEKKIKILSLLVKHFLMIFKMLVFFGGREIFTL